MVKKVLIFRNDVQTTKSDLTSGLIGQIGDLISLDKVHTPFLFLVLSVFIFSLKFVIHSLNTAFDIDLDSPLFSILLCNTFLFLSVAQCRWTELAHGVEAAHVHSLGPDPSPGWGLFLHIR